ncbi:MAG: GTP-binding protein [gamma proteobacterium symbiont of Ctena orbiculata]|nr:ATP/GTP-binding protein [Candidatus Thiodiazotropha taylori]MBV2097336.1 ATP/GTP-binding protein [Candidatus Thiodiazotropha sp. (ex Codakia orbicularis)]PUB88139.1 MAG: GTP-binding protein [gamma proteobacterium symbiont of Ctena orbiculata]MBT2997035.1 ATP/GTP-binding protein [Candidatus Thiodiazotropha taylori]MBT3000890.1 ATP/GTP-binding protein [Candidatus Thiodiazotropha taylori]
MSDFKIIFSGPVGVGKTTAIGSISDIEPVITDEKASDMTSAQKPGTTVAMDYGLIALGERERIHLYGTPGQQRFDFMWEILTQGGIGLILLVSNARPDPFSDMHFFLDAFKHFIAQTKVVIGVTQMDLSKQPRLEDYYLQLEDNGLKIPIFEVDARVKRDISLLVEALLYSIDPGLED